MADRERRVSQPSRASIASPEAEDLVKDSLSVLAAGVGFPSSREDVPLDWGQTKRRGGDSPTET
jgi:hypothetical protein